MKTLQQIYDAGLAHIRAQGKPSIAGTVCKYRTVDPAEPTRTLKCIIGGLIPDELYDPSWDLNCSTVVTDLPDAVIEAVFGRPGPLTRPETSLLQTMQFAHDRAAMELVKPRLRPTTFMECFETKMREVAKEHGLTYTP